MANWDQTKVFIHQNYEAEEISPRALRLVFNLSSGRRGVVYVTYAENDDAGLWAMVESPIAVLSTVDVYRALSLMEDVVCGGLCTLELGDAVYLTIRHGVFLETLDPDELLIPMKVVLHAADHFAQRLVGGPSFR